MGAASVTITRVISSCFTVYTQYVCSDGQVLAQKVRPRLDELGQPLPRHTRVRRGVDVRVKRGRGLAAVRPHEEVREVGVPSTGCRGQAYRRLWG